MRRHDSAFRRFILSAVPAPAGWNTPARGLINLSAFGFAVLAGAWIVHQMEYAIVFGRRFGMIMATTPHRYYMGRLGLVLAVVGLLCGVVSLSMLGVGHVRLQRLRRRLPARYRQYLEVDLPLVPLPTIGATTALLVGLQTTMYVLQENLETLAMSNTIPGLSVLFAPPHQTVMPLQVLVGSFGALLLWTLSSWFRRSRHTGHLAQMLAALCAVSPPRATRPTVPRSYLPGLRLRTHALGLRAPPAPVRVVAPCLAPRQ